uniref:Odorant receptors OR15 n=1 Tax=Lobesia botrana TaxID=209534 RepID=A0A345BEU6_9NEOP|nr:odorant receptors OR15 [Lobesia botrana]
MFFYMAYCSVFYIISFTGFDAFFGITINHACMKMELVCKVMEDAMEERDRGNRKRRMLDVITEQNDVFKMVELIQETFNIWLGIIVIATMLQICNCMYQIIEALEVATRLYCCGWEKVNDRQARNMISFMIARAQVPMKITAFNMFDFDMELFVSILQTSYSMFTLLRS